MVSRTVRYCSTPVDCKTMPTCGLSSSRSPPGSNPRTSTVPCRAAGSPRGSLPSSSCPHRWGPEERRSPPFDLQIDAHQGAHLTVGLDEPPHPHRETLDRGVCHTMILTNLGSGIERPLETDLAHSRAHSVP